MPVCHGGLHAKSDGVVGLIMVATALSAQTPSRRDARAEGRRSGAGLLAGGVRRQDLQAVRLQGQAGGRRWPGSRRRSRSGCTIECKSLAEHGDMIKKYDVTYFMASVDALEGEKGNKAFAEEHKADFPLLSDPTKETAEAYGVLNAARARQPLDVLHRQGRHDRVHRQGRQAIATSAEGHGREARRAEGRREEVSRRLRARSGSRRASATASRSRTGDLPPVVGDAVQDVRRPGRASRGSSSPCRSIQPVTAPSAGEMRAMRVGLPDVGEDLALHEFELVQVVDRHAAVAHRDRARSPSASRDRGSAGRTCRRS